MVQRKRRKQNSNQNGGLVIGAIVAIIILMIVAKSGKADGLVAIVFGIFFIFLFSWLALWYLRRRKRARIRAALLAAGTANPLQLTPVQYEQFCAALLSNNGQNTKATKKTGDFGADIIAEKSGQKLVIQCKQWSISVGVKAVQEAHGALSYYGGNQAIVVTTTGYTKAAINLAKSADVRLLSHTDLVEM